MDNEGRILFGRYMGTLPDCGNDPYANALGTLQQRAAWDNYQAWAMSNAMLSAAEIAQQTAATNQFGTYQTAPPKQTRAERLASIGVREIYPERP